MKNQKTLFLLVGILLCFQAYSTHYWTGSVNHFWNNPGNWDEGTVPGSSNDVIILGGTPNSCWVSVTDQECHNLFIMNGASLRIYDEKLLVYGLMEVYGNLKMDNSSGSLWVAGDFTWNSNATATITAWAPIKVYGDMEFRSGANVQLNNGYVEFLGAGSKQLICKSSASWFNTLQISNTGGIDYNASSSANLVVKNDLVISANSSLYSYCGNSIIVNDQFQSASTGHYYFYSGTFVCNGGNMSLPGGSGDYFRNLTISTTGTTTLNPVHHITVNGDLLIESGILKCNDKDIYIQGDWTNNVGTNGFNEGTSDIRFQGSWAQKCSSETFYDISVDKSASYMYPGVGETIHVTNDVLISSGNLTLNSNSILDVDGMISMVSGGTLDASLVSGINIFVGGGWWDYNSTCNFLCGTSTVTFNNPSNYLMINCNASLYQFHHVNVNSGGSVRILENINITGDFKVIDGYWSHESNHGYNHNFYGDITIEPGGSFRDDEYVTLKGTADQTLTVAGNLDFKYLTIDKTNDDVEGGKSMNVHVSNSSTVEIDVYTDFIIQEGTFNLGSSTLEIWDNMNVNNGGTFTMGPDASLEFHDNGYCGINSGGYFQSVGNINEPARVTRYYTNTYYAFEVNPGGTFGAKHTTFEYMDQSGINLYFGSLLSSSYPFDYCTFQNGESGGTLLTLNCCNEHTIANAVFPSNTWGSSSNVYIGIQLGTITFWHASCPFSGESFDNDFYNKVIWTNDPVMVDGKFFLEGPYNGSNMNTGLNAYLPLNQPFSGPPWNYGGLESVSSIPGSGIVDWVLYELRTTDGAAATATGSTLV
ncbi:MAG: hypothetical protein K8R53_16300, partial [Bacteroidales bacterium]|nr:hypothetical protein [Bacteroidales bacterium]